MSDKIEVRGGDQIREALERIKEKFPEASLKAVKAEGHVVMRESTRLCPVDTGRLRQSIFMRSKGQVLKAEEGAVIVGYGASYALAVHEMTEVHHNEGTQAKFLSTPMDAHRNSWSHDVAERLRAAGIKVVIEGGGDDGGGDVEGGAG